MTGVYRRTLRVVVAELVFPEFVVFLDGPPAAADAGQDRQADRAAFGHEAPEVVDAGGVVQVRRIRLYMGLEILAACRKAAQPDMERITLVRPNWQ
jgi:hypothetical protein